MKSRLETLVAYLAGADDPEADAVRASMDDPASEASQILTVSRLRSRELFSERALKWLGLLPRAPGAGPDLPPRTPAPPQRTAPVWARTLPWLLSAAACLLAAILWVDCRQHRQHLEDEVRKLLAAPKMPDPFALAPPEKQPKGTPPEKGVLEIPLPTTPPKEPTAPGKEPSPGKSKDPCEELRIELRKAHEDIAKLSKSLASEQTATRNALKALETQGLALKKAEQAEQDLKGQVQKLQDELKALKAKCEASHRALQATLEKAQNAEKRLRHEVETAQSQLNVRAKELKAARATAWEVADELRMAPLGTLEKLLGGVVAQVKALPPQLNGRKALDKSLFAAQQEVASLRKRLWAAEDRLRQFEVPQKPPPKH
jgi:hypothetical protein